MGRARGCERPCIEISAGISYELRPASFRAEIIGLAPGLSRQGRRGIDTHAADRIDGRPPFRRAGYMGCVCALLVHLKTSSSHFALDLSYGPSHHGKVKRPQEVDLCRLEKPPGRAECRPR